MPVAPQIANAAYTYNFSAGVLNKSIAGLTPEEWLRRPNDSSNHLLWVLGHIVWTRGRALHFLGIESSKPWFDKFGRGSKVLDSAEYPQPDEIILAWQEIAAQHTVAMEAASEETLAKSSPEGIPSADGKISGLLMFLASHEAYHAGQAAYLHAWLGHGGVAG